MNEHQHNRMLEELQEIKDLIKASNENITSIQNNVKWMFWVVAAISFAIQVRRYY